MESGRRALLRTTGLCVRIGGVSIVEDVSLEVREGEFLVIIGPNGAGKTTLFNVLTGIVRPSSGTVMFGSRDITHAPPYVRARLGLGRTFQTSAVFAGLSVLENASLAARAYLGGSGALWRLAQRDHGALERARHALTLVGLEGRAHTIAATLSHGEKRKLDLAILLCGEPKVALLDEPTAGMAMEDVPEMMRVIQRIQREHGTTILMVEHRMDLILGLADRLAVMHHGALLAIDTPERVIASATVQSAYLGDPL
ncbi:ABC transporter ATP-binding protein [bacterium]|nr:MAG: ABC transporter ATP-binding protein [bacterium]